MISHVHTLASWQILTAIVAAIIAGVVLAPLLRRRVLKIPDDDKIAAGAFEAFKAVAAFTGFVLAFSLTQVQTSMRNAEELVAREAASINVLDRTLARSGDPHLAELRPALMAYVKGVIEIEWPLLQDAKRSIRVDDLYRTFSVPARSMDPQSQRQQVVFGELVRTLDEVSDFRDMRVAMAGISLSQLFWYTAFGMILILVLLAGLMASSLDRAFTLGGIAAAIALLLSLVAVIDGPFQGKNAVPPVALDRVIVLMQARH